MDYGIPWVPDSSEIRELCLCPFQLFRDQDIWALCKRRSITLSGKKINIIYRIHEYTSIGDLLFDFLQDGHWFCTLSSETKGRLDEDIDKIYFFESSASKNFTYKQKFQLVQQFTRREIRGAKTVSAPILSHIHDTAVSLNIDPPKTYAEALDFAKKVKFELPENDILEFDNSDELAAWALAYLVEHDKIIGRCKTCNRYYIRSHGNSKYCGFDCYDNRSTTGACLGESEILLRYKRVGQWFTRKLKSRSEYKYLDNSNYIGTYNAKELFSHFAIAGKAIDPAETIFTANDFSLLKDAYKRAYSMRYSEVKKTKDAFDCSEVLEEEYQEVLDSFLLWLDNVKIQLDCFSIYRDARGK